jgi:hypothetical protein
MYEKFLCAPESFEITRRRVTDGLETNVLEIDCVSLMFSRRWLQKDMTPCNLVDNDVSEDHAASIFFYHEVEGADSPEMLVNIQQTTKRYISKYYYYYYYYCYY